MTDQELNSIKRASYTCNAFFPDGGKALREAFRKICRPVLRQKHISPRRHVKWRLQKKWFRRYERPMLIGSVIMASQQDGNVSFRMRVTDARISKAGGRRRKTVFTSLPLDENEFYRNPR